MNVGTILGLFFAAVASFLAAIALTPSTATGKICVGFGVMLIILVVAYLVAAMSSYLVHRSAPRFVD